VAAGGNGARKTLLRIRDLAALDRKDGGRVEVSLEVGAGEIVGVARGLG
jgi:ABC-type uncharacterized transport system ATPase subunit